MRIKKLLRLRWQNWMDSLLFSVYLVLRILHPFRRISMEKKYGDRKLHVENEKKNVRVEPQNVTRYNNEKKTMKRSGDKRGREEARRMRRSRGDNEACGGNMRINSYPFILYGAAHVAMHAARGARCITKRISIIINRPILRNDKNAVSLLFSIAAASPALASLAQASDAPRGRCRRCVYLMSLIP